MTSKEYLKQIAESKGVCPLTNEVKDNALLFPIGFEKIFQDLDRLEKMEKPMKPPLIWENANPKTRCKCTAGVIPKDNYCWNCGQRLDWTNDEVIR